MMMMSSTRTTTTILIFFMDFYFHDDQVGFPAGSRAWVSLAMFLLQVQLLTQGKLWQFMARLWVEKSMNSAVPDTVGSDSGSVWPHLLPPLGERTHWGGHAAAAGVLKGET